MAADRGRQPPTQSLGASGPSCRRLRSRRVLAWRGLGSPRPHLHLGTGPSSAASASGLGALLSHRHGDRALPCHICAGTGRRTVGVGVGVGVDR